MGFRKKYVILAPCFVQTNVNRTKYPPWGVVGGKDAKPGYVTVYKAKGGTENISKVRRYPVEPGDVVVLETGGGGGWGDPRERPTEFIERDLRRGYITKEAAERDHACA